MKKDAVGLLKVLGFYFALNVGTFLMIRIITQYSAFDDHAGFLAYKQDYLQIGPWRAAFYIHVFSAIITLLAGFTQFSAEILLNHRWIHKLAGKIYAWAVIFINFPTGLILAIYANGLLPTKVAFVILDSLWLWFTIKAVIEVKKGNIVLHREYMIRSYALTFSAITLRTWRLILTSSTDLNPQVIYMLDAWLGFVPNLICAEWVISQGRKNLQRLNPPA